MKYKCNKHVNDMLITLIIYYVAISYFDLLHIFVNFFTHFCVDKKREMSVCK